MFSSTKDILFLVISISIAAITIFLCWSLYYLIITLRDFGSIIGALRKKFAALIEFINHTKEKMESTASAATAVSQAAIEVIKYVKKKKEKSKGEK